MTRHDVVRDLRAALDRENPDWRAVLRRQMNDEKPGWTAAQVRVELGDGRVVDVAVLANPSRVPDPADVDPADDPFADGMSA